MLSIFPYAATSFVRGRRRTVASVLGVLLAITFIAGTFIALDTSTRSAVNTLLSAQPGDFLVQTTSWDVSALTEALGGVDGVSNVSPVVRFEIQQVGVWGSQPPVDSEGLGVDSGNPPVLVRNSVIEGTANLSPGEVALSRSLAWALDASLGDTVYLHNVVYNASSGANESHFLNATVGGVLAPGTGSAGLADALDSSKVFFVGLRDVARVRSALGLLTPPSWALEVRVDPSRFIDPFDLGQTRYNLLRMGRTLQAVAGLNGTSVRDNDSPVLLTLEGDLIAQRVILVLFAVPVILLGLYLGVIGIDLGHAERRRELAVAQSRGASRRQLMAQLLFESVLGGLVATFAGLALGAFVSRLLLVSVNPVEAVIPSGDVGFSLGTIALVSLLSIGFMAALTYRSARRTAGLPLVETLRYYTPGETETRYKPGLDVALVAFSLVTFGLTWLGQAAPGNFLVFLGGPVSSAFLPFAPVLLIVGATRLLTRASGRGYELVSHLWKPFARDLHVLISRNLVRNPRRSANVALIISLGLAFAVFAVALSGSEEMQLQQAAWASVGGDARASLPSPNATWIGNVSAIPGVVGISRIGQLHAQASFCCASVYVLDPATYFGISQPGTWATGALSSDQVRAVLENPGAAMISQAYAQGASLAPGDPVGVDVRMEDAGSGSPVTERLNVTIGGVVRFLPGFDPAATSVPSAVYVSFATLDALPNRSNLSFAGSAVLIDLTPGASWPAVREALTRMGATEVIGYPDRLAAASTAPLASASRGFIDVEIAFVVIMLTAGLSLIVYAASLERDVEFAGILARGSSRWQTAAVLVGEGFVIMVLGTGVGVSVGLVSSFATLGLSQQGPSQSLIPLSFTVPYNGIVLLALAPIAMVVTSVAISSRIARMDIARVLKLRGG